MRNFLCGLPLKMKRKEGKRDEEFSFDFYSVFLRRHKKSKLRTKKLFLLNGIECIKKLSQNIT